MTTYRIAMIPGDGVGTEVTTEAEKILKTTADRFTFGVATEWFDWGCDSYLKNGVMMPDEALEILKAYDAIFLGCLF